MRLQRGASLFLFVIGLFFFLAGQGEVTGAVVGSASSSLGSFLGLSLMLFASLVFVAEKDEEHDLEKRIRLTSALKRGSGLVRYAEQATRNQELQADMNHLLEELGRGHPEAGKGTKHFAGTDIFYMRGNKGARLFYRRTQKGYEVVGKAAGTGKKGNEYAVMKKLQKLYGH